MTPRSPPRGRRQGRLATITFGYQPKASGQGTGQRPQGPAPGLKGYRPCRRPRQWVVDIFLESWHEGTLAGTLWLISRMLCRALANAMIILTNSKSMAGMISVNHSTHTSRSKKCLYVSLLQDGGSVDSAKWHGLHSKPLWKAVPCERRPGDQVISACMPPLRRHSCVYKSERPNPSPAHDAERPVVQNNAMEGVRLKHARTRDMMPRPSQKPSATPPTKSA